MTLSNMLVVIFILVVVLVLIAIWRSKRQNLRKIIEHEIEAAKLQSITSPKNVKFSEDLVNDETKALANKLEKLKHDVGQLVMKSATGDRQKIMQMYHGVMSKYNGEKIAIFVDSLPQHQKKDITLDGATIKDPVLKMYNKNFSLFSRLYNSGLIPLLGNIVAMSYWIQTATDKSSMGFSHFVKCLNSINWSSKDVWSSIDAANGHVAQCVKQN